MTQLKKQESTTEQRFTGELIIPKIIEEQTSGSPSNMDAVLTQLKKTGDHSVRQLFAAFMKYTSPEVGVYLSKSETYRPIPLNRVLYNKDLKDMTSKTLVYKYDQNHQGSQEQIHFDPLSSMLQPLLSVLCTYYDVEQLRRNYLVEVEGGWKLTTSLHLFQEHERLKDCVSAKNFSKKVNRNMHKKIKDILLSDEGGCIKTLSLLDARTKRRTLQPALVTTMDNQTLLVDLESELIRGQQHASLGMIKELTEISQKQPPYYSCAYFDNNGKHIPFYQSKLIRKWMINQKFPGQNSDLWQVFLKHRKEVELRIAKFLLHSKQLTTADIRRDGSLDIKCTACKSPDNLWRYFTLIEEQHALNSEIKCPLCKSLIKNPNEELELVASPPLQSNALKPLVTKAILRCTFAQLIGSGTQGENHVFFWSTKTQLAGQHDAKSGKIAEPEVIFHKEEEKVKGLIHQSGITCWPEVIGGFKPS